MEVAAPPPYGSVAHVRAVLEPVVDPEIPVLTIADLGVLRDVAVDGGRVTVTITPTYSGCPAMHAISADVRTALVEAGYPDPDVRTVLAPAWTTDWMSEAGRAKLAAFGIAPPAPVAAGGCAVASTRVALALSVRCPHCGSTRTRERSRFGSTACKALWVCDECLEPFDHFKAL
jgi:ring-1,2-phenylacetyl-CoA epoxidase subunit PaaD